MAAVSAAAATERGEPLPASDVGTFAAEVENALAGLREAVDKAGLRRDAYGVVIDAQARMLALMPGFLGRMAQLAERGREPLDPTALARLEQAAVKGGDRRAAELARAHNRRTVLIAAGVLVGSIVAAGGGGYWWGHTSAVAGVRETEAGLADAFRDGPGAAAGWVSLMRLNDLPRALATCTGDRAFTDQTGSASCYVPLRLRPPQPTLPMKAGH